ncbi:hypothetical protein FNJ84_13530 [Paracoccus sp. M683]|uniref:PepSY domain-containing protein n=1 Tax=Paracoccus sp. M683 TaxID=2594268 RepID=UPI00117E318D|nr:PepSY domain-containing protein [Paracoccus sp. M683]TRW96298.1 hypothetical protein FNJ84_13530 [Paracoccus sp. M683]
MRMLVQIAVLTTLAAPGLALAQDATCPQGLATGAVLGKTLDEVGTNLTALGFEIRKGEAEDEKIEVYFTADAAMGEVYVSPETGMITKMSYETE